MKATNLYQQIVLDHHHAPRHARPLPRPTHAADGHNPLCGDHLRVELRLEGDTVRDIACLGEACAITTATASMMGERVIGLTRAQIASLSASFAASLGAAPDTATDATLGDLAALGELRRYPARRKCALLPWATLQAAFANLTTTSTETDDTPFP